MERGAGLARAIAIELGLPPAPIRDMVGSGSVNHVFVMGSGRERWVVRFARDPFSPDVFEAEAWCARRAGQRGVPTPDVTASGTLGDIPYGVQRFVAGRTLHDDASSTPWLVLGSYGRVINNIQPDASAPASLFSRFGTDLERAWSSHVTYNLEQLDRADPLLRQGFYSRNRQAQLADSLRELMDLPAHFGLSHGDLTSRNLIAPGSGPLVLIDWGSASFGPVPWTDLLILDRDARHTGTSVEPDVDAYLDAVGLNRAAIWPTFEKFRELQLLDLVRWAAEQRPERLLDTMDDLASVL